MDRVIRITSQQGFSDSWSNAQGATTLNLLDFVIPSGLTVDLSKSYIAVNAQVISDDDAPCNSTMFLDTVSGDDYNVPISAVIKNASISNGRGAVENIRRVDTLNCAMFGLLDDMESQQNNLNTFANYEQGRGIGNQTSYFLDAVTNNVQPDGLTINALHTSREIARDLKVPLAELFGVANSTAYSTDLMGSTRIHCETNFGKVKSKVLGGSEPTSLSFNETDNWGDFEDQDGKNNGDVIGSIAHPLQTKYKTPEFQFVFPFFVGQKVLANATVTGGGALIPGNTPCIIQSIQYQQDNTTSPPTPISNDVFVTLTRENGDPFYAFTATGNITGITLKAKVDQTTTCVVNRAELVLQITDEEPEQQITYDTWTTEEDVGNQTPNFNRAYSLEGETTLWMACFVKASQILPNTNILSYRYSIDNEEETGNRSIVMNNGANGEGSSLQYDRLIRALDNQGGMGFRNAQLRYYKSTLPQATAFDSPVSVIVETAPATPNMKVLSLNVENSGTLDEIKIYKQVQRTI